MSRCLAFLLLVLAPAILLSCSSAADSAQPGLDNAANAIVAAHLPTVPSARSASVLLGFAQDGVNTFSRELNAWDEGTGLRLASSTASFTWGIWGFGSATGASSCLVEFSGEPGHEAYFAIANYATNSWEVGGPLPGPLQEFAIDSPDYVSSAGDLFVAVITTGGASVRVDQLVLTADKDPIQRNVDFAGGHTSLAMIDGQPAISYYDDADDNLCYVRATDLFGADWGEPVTVDSVGDTGMYTSLDIVDGKPAIAYYDVTEKNVRYVRSLDVLGAEWDTPVTVDGETVDTGEFCSLEVVAGFPAISYYHYDGPALRYARALDTAGAEWGDPVDVDTEGNTGQYTSLKVVDGFPAISYRNGGAGELRYVRSDDDEGATWVDPLILDSVGSAGFYSGLLVVNGKPAICYYDNSDSWLRYIRATDAAGTGWSVIPVLDGLTDDAGSYCSMAVIGGKPAITYHNGLNGDLRYVKALDADGALWSAGVILDETSVITGRDTSLLEVYGQAAVSYFDLTNAQLRYMWGF